MSEKGNLAINLDCKFAVGFLEGHIKTEEGAPDDYVLGAPILLRQQDAGSLICKDCLQEIGRSHLKIPSSPNYLQAIKISSLLTSLYGAYKERIEPIIQQISEQGLKNKVSNSIKSLVEDIKCNLQRAIPEQRSTWTRDNFQHLIQSNPEFEDKLKKFVTEAAKPGADISQLTKDLLSVHDLQANKKNISDYLLNHTIAYSLPFVVHNDLALKQITADALPAEVLAATVTQQGELAQSHEPYTTTLKAQDLVDKTKLPENYLQHQQNSQELEAKINEVMAQMQNKLEKYKNENSVLDKFLHKIDEIFKSNKTNPPKEPEQKHFYKLQSSVREALGSVKSKAQKAERTAKLETQYQPSLTEIKVSVLYGTKTVLANKNQDVNQQRANKWQQIRAIRNRRSSYNARQQLFLYIKMGFSYSRYKLE